MEKRAESAILALSPFYSTSHFESSKMRFEFLIFFLFLFPSTAITVDPKRGLYYEKDVFRCFSVPWLCTDREGGGRGKGIAPHFLS